MNIKLYSTTDDPRMINKTLSLIAENVSCKPAAPFNLITPNILLDYSSSYNAVNYIYLDDFDRYYFAELSLISGRELQLSCKLDPLMSFDLSNVSIMAIRSESAGVNYVPDHELPIDPCRMKIHGDPLSADPLGVYDSSQKHYILITNG